MPVKPESTVLQRISYLQSGQNEQHLTPGSHNHQPGTLTIDLRWSGRNWELYEEFILAVESENGWGLN